MVQLDTTWHFLCECTEGRTNSPCRETFLAGRRAHADGTAWKNVAAPEAALLLAVEICPLSSASTPLLSFQVSAYCISFIFSLSLSWLSASWSISCVLCAIKIPLTQKLLPWLQLPRLQGTSSCNHTTAQCHGLDFLPLIWQLFYVRDVSC